MVSRILPALVLCVSLISCSAPAPESPVIPERSNADVPSTGKLPITQIKQTLNLTSQQTFRFTLAALQRRGVQIASAREDDGVMESDWLNVKDTICGNAKMEGAPLECRTRISVKVIGINPEASALHIRYEEFCSLNGETPVLCSGSAGEKLMISVVEEVEQASQ